MELEKMFFMVYLENERTPTYKHSTLKSAEIEAKRLAKEHNKKATILASLYSYEVSIFKEIKHAPDENNNDLTDALMDLPF